jgi:hypothetical protein
VLSQWYYTRVGGKTNGPYSVRKLRQLASAGQLRPDDRLRMDGNAKSVRAGNIDGLFSPSAPDAFTPATD